jgi:hypothetical protein
MYLTGARRHAFDGAPAADAEPQESVDFDVSSVAHRGDHHRKSKFQGTDLSEPPPTRSKPGNVSRSALRVALGVAGIVAIAVIGALAYG